MQNDKIKMQNVRLSFPSLFQTETFGGTSTGKYAATFILDKKEHAKTIKEIQAHIKEMVATEFKGKGPSDDRICLKDGDDDVRPESEGKFTIKASTKKRPLVLNRDKTPVTEEDEVFYAGCHVNAIISLWAQNSKDFGKRINGSLDGVMFNAHGEPFGAAGISVDEFDAFGDGDDDMPF